MTKVNPSLFGRFPFRPMLKGRGVLPGKFPSSHVGIGNEFYGLRRYQPGDEARKISWKRYAQTGELAVRDEIIESNMRVWIVLDLSASMKFGGKPALLAGFCLFAEHLLREGNNSMGYITFARDIKTVVQPRMGTAAIRSARALLYGTIAEQNEIASIPRVCDFASKHTRRGDVIFVVSDFFSADDLQKSLSSVSGGRELIPVVIRDPRESMYSRFDNVRIHFQDMETGGTPPVSQASCLKDYDGHLTQLLSALSPGYLWIEGDSSPDAVLQIAKWLYRRSKIR